MSDRGADKVNHHIDIPKRLVKLATEQLPDGASLLVVAPEDMGPEFIRLPGQKVGDRCPVCGLSVGRMRALLREARGKIKAVYLRAKGTTNGIALVHRQSLIDYLHSLPPPPWIDEPEPVAPAEEEDAS